MARLLATLTARMQGLPAWARPIVLVALVAGGILAVLLVAALLAPLPSGGIGLGGGLGHAPRGGLLGGHPVPLSP